MKKYCIVIGEENEEASRKVQEALFAVGFKWCAGTGREVNDTDSPLIFVNVSDDKCVHHRAMGSLIEASSPIGSAEILAPSYVIKNAHKLDGAKKAWETPPEGYRLVMDEELSNYPYPERGIGDNSCVKWIEEGSSWSQSRGEAGWGENSGVIFAVPQGFTFEQEEEIIIDGKTFSESTIKAALRAYID
jgi:hypothetical protein